MANQILAGAVFQAGQVIAGVDADNPPYVGPPVPTYLVVRVAEGDKTSGSYPYQDRLYLYDVYNIESDPIVVNNPNGDDANQWNNYSDGFGNPNTVITSGSQQLFVGAPLEDFGGLGNQGGVYVYDKSDLTTPVTTMTSPTPSENGYFGRSVATNDTHLFVGEQGNQKLYIYDLSDLSASPTVILDTRPAANSQWNFAAHLHVTNTHLVIGDDNYDTSSASYNHGSVSIYDLSDLSSPIHLTDQDLQGACSWMGLRISNDGSQFYVGVNASWNPDNSAIHYGQMQIRDIATGNLVSTITYPAPNGNYAAFAGYIEETDDKFILSAMLEEVGGDTQQGRVYVYDKSNLSSPSTIISSPLTGDNTDSGSDRFGASLVTDDNYLYVSDRGSAGAGSSYAIWGSPGAYVWRYDLSDLSATPYQITEPAVDRAEHIQQFGTFIHMVQFPFPVSSSPESSSGGSTSSYIVTNSYRNQDNGPFSGSVYVFDGNGENETKILSSDNVAYQMFGFQVDTNGTKIVASGKDDSNANGTKAGCVFVYDMDGTNELKLLGNGSTTNTKIGWKIACSENKVAASAFGSSQVWVWNLDGSGQTQINTPIYMGELAMTDDVLIVIGNDYQNAGGSVRALRYDINTGQLLGHHDHIGSPGKVDTNGSKYIIGDRNHTVNGQSDVGAAYVYNMDGSGETMITPSDTSVSKQFGLDVAINDSNKVAILTANDPDSVAAVYVYDADGNNEVKITPSSTVVGSEPLFGYTVELTSTKVVVGDQTDDTEATNSGALFMYNLDGTGEKVVTTLDAEEYDMVGHSLGAAG